MRFLVSLVCVILAAGRSERMGFDKLARPRAGGGTLLQNALLACAAYDIVVVASPELSMQPVLHGRTVVVNDVPQRGMSYSLKLADARIDAGRSLAVVPADLPLLDAHLLQTVFARAMEADVCFPVRADGTSGHPVVFSPQARALLAGLRDGDSLRDLRDAAGLSQLKVPVQDERPYFDIDLPDQF
jgi:CTP:molybdopterin cytidylyltransferase MocA